MDEQPFYGAILDFGGSALNASYWGVEHVSQKHFQILFASNEVARALVGIRRERSRAIWASHALIGLRFGLGAADQPTSTEPPGHKLCDRDPP